MHKPMATTAIVMSYMRKLRASWLCGGLRMVAFEGWTEPIAIMSYTESDTPTHCEECRILIPHALTDYGFLYVLSD